METIAGIAHTLCVICRCALFALLQCKPKCIRSVRMEGRFICYTTQYFGYFTTMRYLFVGQLRKISAAGHGRNVECIDCKDLDIEIGFIMRFVMQ